MKKLKSPRRWFKGSRVSAKEDLPNLASQTREQSLISTEEVSSRTWGKVLGGMEQVLELAKGVVEGFSIPGAAPAIGLALSVVSSIRVRSLFYYGAFQLI